MLLLALTLLHPAAGAPLATGAPLAAEDAPWREFQRTWGSGWRRYARDARSPLTALTAPGVPEAKRVALVADIARLNDTDPSELVQDKTTRHPTTGRSIVRYARRWHGAEVVDDQVAFVVQHGKIGTVWVRLSPLGGLPEPQPGEWVMPKAGGSTLVTRVQTADAIEWHDRSGAVVRSDPTRLDTNLTVTAAERAPGGPMVTSPARDVAVTTDLGTELTDDAGTVSGPAPWNVALDGALLSIYQSGELVTVPDVSDGDLLGGTDLSLAAANVLVEYHALRDWLHERWPDSAWMDEPTYAVVDDESIPCNAYYVFTSDSFMFGAASEATVPPCRPMGEFADAVHHESGHRIHSLIRAAGRFDATFSEGSADYIAATMADDPVIAGGVRPDGYAGSWPDYTQEIQTDHVYPDDWIGETHEDGRIWSSALWNLRETWKAKDGDAGVRAVDELLLGALEQGPELTSAWIAVLAADDDDGDASNGTPHDCELMDNFDAHGIGPGAEGTFSFAGTVLPDQPSEAAEYPVSVTVDALMPACPGRDVPAAVRVWWTTDATAPVPAPGEPAAGWNAVDLVADGDTWSGAIPRLPAGSLVRYYEEVETATGRSEVSHAGDPEALGTFLVGDQRVVWCDDLEGDLSGWTPQLGWVWSDDQPERPKLDWEAGTPTGARAYDPEAAVSGTTIWATGLSADYSDRNAEYLLSPPVDLGAPGVMRTLTYERLLRIDDGRFDQAGVWAADPSGVWSPLWTNVTTTSGEEPTLESAWSHRVLPLAAVLAPGETAENFQVAFTLQTDSSGKSSGWNLDDVCVYELAEPDDQYDVDELQASASAGAVTLSWTVPWVTPITDVAVVRSVHGAPSSLEDGDVVAHLTPAAPGAPMRWTDDDHPDSELSYGLFLASAPGTYWGDGTNAVTVQAGCGCSTSPAGIGLPWVAALAVIAARRRAQVRA